MVYFRPNIYLSSSLWLSALFWSTSRYFKRAKKILTSQYVAVEFLFYSKSMTNHLLSLLLFSWRGRRSSWRCSPVDVGDVHRGRRCGSILWFLEAVRRETPPRRSWGQCQGLTLILSPSLMPASSTVSALPVYFRDVEQSIFAWEYLCKAAIGMMV